MSRRTWLTTIAVTLAACASAPPPTGTRDLLDVVKPGAPRVELVSRLGAPFAAFEGERIMAWRIGQDTGGYFVGSRQDVAHPLTRYELLVVFDADGRVVKHSLVEIHKPQ